jgi:hypothetical protein
VKGREEKRKQGRKEEKRKQQGLARLWRNCNTCALLVEMQNDAGNVENSMEVP